MRSGFRKYIVAILCIFSLWITGCGQEPTSPALLTQPTVQTVLPTDTSAATEPTAANEATWPENKMSQVFDLDGMTIRLPKSFKRNTVYQEIVLETWYSYIVATREPLASHPDLHGMTLEQYAQTIKDMIDPNVKLQWRDGILCLEYELPVEGGAVYYHWITFFKTGTDFWILQFVCDAREAGRYQIQFTQWAKSIEFTEPEHPFV